MLGRTVGKYRIIERLGRGGMGTVYKAIDETLDREVAIKVLNADFGDAELLKRFRAEAVTLARLNHPGIATLYELYRDADELLMVMEFVRGETVNELSERMGALAPPQAAHVVIQALDALAHAHHAGVVHRDLKPANLMITHNGVVKVMDFGIARVLGTEHFTQSGFMMGTPAYMAPEQVLGGDIDGRADLYAIGVVLYRLLSAQLPFSADTAIAMVQKQVSDSPIPIAQVQPGLPAWCTRVLTRALAKSPGDRFQTADEFKAELMSAVQPQALGELPTMATPNMSRLSGAGGPTAAFPGRSDIPAGTPAPPTPAAQRDVRADAAMVSPPVAVATPVPPPPQPAAAAPPQPAKRVDTSTTVVLGRKHLVGFGAVTVVVFLAIAALGYLALRRTGIHQMQIGAQPPEDVRPASDASPAPARDASAGATPSAAASPPAPPSAPVAPAPPKPVDGAAATAKAAGRGDPTAAVSPGASARGARGTAPPTPASTEPAASGTPAPEAPPAPPASSLAPVTFDDVRLLVKNGDKTRELNGVLALGDGHVTVLDKIGGKPLMSLAYSAITGAAYSRSKQPKWKDEGGKDVEAKVDLGRLGFLRSERNWLIFFSSGEPTFIRIEDNSLRTVLPAIESHAGVRIRR
jgi:serine/threonine-protein kinase